MEPSHTRTQPRGFGGGSRAPGLDAGVLMGEGVQKGRQLAGGCLTGQAHWGLSLG